MPYYVRLSKVNDRGQASDSTLLKIPDSMLTDLTKENFEAKIGAAVANVLRGFNESKGEQPCP